MDPFLSPLHAFSPIVLRVTVFSSTPPPPNRTQHSDKLTHYLLYLVKRTEYDNKVNTRYRLQLRLFRSPTLQ